MRGGDSRSLSTSSVSRSFITTSPSRRRWRGTLTFTKTSKDNRLKRIHEGLYLAQSRAICQAVWEKQYRPSLNTPFERQRGLVRIMLEKFGDKWKIIDLQGYPIFGTSGLKLPDLTVTNVWIMGGGRRIIGVVKNIGPGTAKGFYVGFYAGTTFLGKAFVATLAPKQSKNISWVWTPDPNRRLSDIRVVADVTHRVKELREDNNVGKIPIRPGDTSYCVDLVINDRGLDVPSSIKAGATVQVGNTVTTAPPGDIRTLKEGEKGKDLWGVSEYRWLGYDQRACESLLRYGTPKQNRHDLSKGLSPGSREGEDALLFHLDRSRFGEKLLRQDPPLCPRGPGSRQQYSGVQRGKQHDRAGNSDREHCGTV